MAPTTAKKKRPARNRSPKPRAIASAKPWPLRRTLGLEILEAPAFARLDWLAHGFSTRPRGANEQQTPQRNREKFFRAIGADRMRPLKLRQIHSDVAHLADSALASLAEPPQGDALFTRELGLLLAVETADCVPILLADPKTRALAAIHAGWRGTLRRIAAKTLGRMQMEFGARPEDVIAALGPSIGRCCYEVGPEVAKEFQAQFPNARDWFDGPFDALASDEAANPLPWLSMAPPGHEPPAPRVHLDLIAANRAILIAAGVAPKNISSSDYCTACRSDLFFSYRRERSARRMIAAIAIR